MTYSTHDFDAACAPKAIQTEAESLLDRLITIRDIFEGIRATTGKTADKIVGIEPPRDGVKSEAGGTVVPVQPFFLARLGDAVNNLEITAYNIQNQIERIHRQF